MVKYVYDFSEGNKDLKDLLGGKGANLAEMTNLGLPVPPGFTITTDACRTYMGSGVLPPELRVEVTMAVRRLEDAIGRSLGDFHDPLLVSVRSGAKFSMPGMMETVLNVGLNDASVQGLADFAGNERFAWDSYRRLIQMFGKTVLDIDGDLFADALDAKKKAVGATSDTGLTRGRPARAGRGLQGHRQGRVRPRLPAAPARAARPGHRGGLQLLEHRSRPPVPPPRADLRRPGHRGQRGRHGVRQPR